MEQLREAAGLLRQYIQEKEPVKAQYTLTQTETREITMENGEFTLFRTLFDNHVTIKVICDQKTGSTRTNKLHPDALKEALDSALTVAESGTAEPYFDIAKGMEPQSFTMGVVEPDIDSLMKRAVQLSEDIANRHPKILVMQIILKHEKQHGLYGNTNGSLDETTSGCYSIMIEFAGNDGTNSTGIAGSQVVFDNLSLPLIDLGSIEKDLKDAEDSLNPMNVEGKFQGPVIFTPMCAAQMIYFGLGVLINDDVILDGTGQWLNRLGEKVASPQVTIAMNPWDSRIICHEVHTDDGFRSQDYTVIENGILKSYMDSLYVANKCNLDRAGNSGFDLIMEPGDMELAEMIKGVERGLLVGSVSCGHPTANAEISGVAKNSFYIEQGQIKGAVSETMISFNLMEMFQNICELSKEVLQDGTMVVPYVKVDGILISGK